MPKLTDYIKVKTIKQLQETYSSACGGGIYICDLSGKPIADKSADHPPIQAGTNRFEAPITVQGHPLAHVVVMDEGTDEPRRNRLEKFAKLTADMLSRLAGSQKTLRARAEELTTLFRLTGEFTAQSDLKAVLDLVTKTVVKVMDAKACAIRLLSENRTELVVQSVANLSPEYLNKGPILLSKSKVDQEVLGNLQPVYIEDQRHDERVMYPAESRREGIVSALCAPLIYKGRPEGVIRVYMSRLHKFDWFEVSMLQAIASQAAAAIVNARLHSEAVRLANVERQLRLAGMVQRRMIPSEPPRIEGFDIGCDYVPCFELGGDFFDFDHLDEDNLAVTVCDVVGKGIRASLLMAALRALLHAHASNIYEISEVIERVNRDMCADTLSSDFATMFYGVLDVKSRRLTYTNAGHPPALLVRDRSCERLTTGGTIIGMDESLQWERESLDLQSGDVVLMYTDGLLEAMNFKDQAFGRQRIEAALLEAIDQGYNAQAIIKHVLWQMRRFAGLQKRFDDTTLVVIKVL